MSHGELKRFALLGNHLPRQCGIATFTTHLAAALANELPHADALVLAMNDAGRRHAYPSRVRFEIAQSDLGAAAHLSEGKAHRTAQNINAGLIAR